MVEGLATELEGLGYRPGVVDFGTDTVAAPRVNLLPRSTQAAGGPGRLVVSLIVVVVSVSLIAGAFGIVSYGRRVAKINEYHAKLEALGGKSRSGPRTDDDLGGVRRQAWLESQKVSQPSMAIMLEALSRTLPDEAWLNRLEANQGTVTIAGSAANAARLIGLLEASQHFSEVQFSAPTTRAEGEAVDSFTITAKIVPGRELR
jgi:general secretion pathway protein L